MQNTLTGRQLLTALRDAARAMTEKYGKEIRKLDAEIGDGDLGITVQKGFSAMADVLEDTSADPPRALKQAGTAFNEANPSTFGALFGTGLRKAGNALKDAGEVGVRELAGMFDAAAQGIMKLGKAQRGDKTLLDALIPAAESLDASAREEVHLLDAVQRAAAAAEEGMSATVDMVSRQGRARSFGERTRGVQDPGATVLGRFFQELAAGVTGLLQ
jgi:dihydroxyacetone kinase-like protein